MNHLAVPCHALLILFLFDQADKLTALITAAKVPEMEPIWATLFAKALEGKDVKDLLTNVGSGGGAAPAAAGAVAGGAAAGGDAAPAEEEKKEEGKSHREGDIFFGKLLTNFVFYREGGVRRRHGLRSVRLSGSLYDFTTTSLTSKRTEWKWQRWHLDEGCWKEDMTSTASVLVQVYASSDGAGGNYAEQSFVVLMCTTQSSACPIHLVFDISFLV